MNDWILVAIVIGAGLVVGSAAGRLVRWQLGKPSRNAALQSIAVPSATLVFSVVLITSLVVALGVVDDDALADLPTSVVNYLPRLLAAMVVLLAGTAVARLADATVQRTARGATGATAVRLGFLVRAAILAATGILAAAQAGIDTTIVNLAAAALLFSIGAASALLVGFGGRDVAREIAAGRAYRSIVATGDRIVLDGLEGTVGAVHPVAFEFDDGSGDRRLVPHSRLLDEEVVVRRRNGD